MENTVTISEEAMQKRYTVAEIASRECIDRSQQEKIQEVEAILAQVTPDLRVSDGFVTPGEDQPKVLTMRELALEHKRTRMPEETMNDEEAWQWANADIVFGGFAPA